MSRKAALSRRTVLAGMATAGVAPGLGPIKLFAQSGTEVSYNTFLDPANANDPRSAAQSRMIEAFDDDLQVVLVVFHTAGKTPETGLDPFAGVEHFRPNLK